jgi:hypothetical protein
MNQAAAADESDVISKVEQVADSEWRADVLVDEREPFFFDHELDHVPGMLLTEACLRAVERCARLHGVSGANEPLHFTSIKMSFGCFCEKTSPAQIRVRSIDPSGGSWSVQALQDGAQLATGHVEVRSLSSAQQSPFRGPPAPVLRRAERQLVHKLVESNVLISPVSVEADAALHVGVISPGLRQPWSGASEQSRSPVELIEAGRQFGTLAMHAANGLPFSSQFVLQHFTLTLSRPIHPAEHVQLRGTPRPPRRHEVHGTEHVLASGDVIGQLDFSALLLPGPVYARLRGRPKPARAETTGAERPSPSAGLADTVDAKWKGRTRADARRETASTS